MALTELQAATRADGIGASEVATIMGLNPFETAFDLFLRKTGQLPPIDTTEAIEWGNDLEPVIIKRAGRLLGKRVVRATATFKHDNGVMLANVDAMVEKSQRGSPIVEAKSTSVVEGWGEEGSDQVPDHVWLQVQAQMLCAGSEVAHVARMLGRFGFSFTLYPVQRANKSTMDLLEERVLSFWNDHVLTGKPPENCQPSIEAMSRVARTAVVVPMNPDLFTAYVAANEARKKAEEAEENAKVALLADLRTEQGEYADQGVCALGTAKYTQINQTRFDAAALKAAQPEVHALYMKASSYRKLTVKAAQGAGT